MLNFIYSFAYAYISKNKSYLLMIVTTKIPRQLHISKKLNLPKGISTVYSRLCSAWMVAKRVDANWFSRKYSIDKLYSKITQIHEFLWQRLPNNARYNTLLDLCHHFSKNWRLWIHENNKQNISKLLIKKHKQINFIVCELK